MLTSVSKPRTSVLVVLTLCTAMAMSVFQTVPAHADVALAFTSATAVQGSDGNVTIDWATTGTDPALASFKVERVESSTPTTVDTTEPVLMESIDDLTGVSPGVHTFSYTITAQGPADEVIATVDTSEFSAYAFVPGPPGSFTSTVGADGTLVDLEWTPPTINASLLGSYSVARSVEGNDYTFLNEASERTIEENLASLGLSAGVHEVRYTITAQTGDPDLGTTEGGSLIATVYIFVDVPSWPDTVNARMTFDGKLPVVEWSAPASNLGLLTNFTVTRSVNGGLDSAVGSTGSAGRRFVDSHTPATGASVVYTVTSMAGDAFGGSQPAFMTVSHSALKLHAPRLGSKNHALIVTWNAPASGESTVKSYSVRYRKFGTTAWTKLAGTQIDKADRRGVIEELVNGTSYQVQIMARDVVGNRASDWSLASKAPAAAKPSVPRAMKAVHHSHRVTLTWTAPVSTGGAHITSYTVMWRGKFGGTWGAWSHRSVDALTAGIKGLTNGHVYEFKVAAVNRAGTGHYTPSVKSTPI
jgi:hypothetical protein